MARGKRVSRGLPHSSIPQSDSQPLEHNRQSVSAGRFECLLPGCSSSLGTKDAFKKHLQGHFSKNDPGISADLLHEAGFTTCVDCKLVLVTIKRSRCTSCLNDSRHSSKSNGSSCESLFNNSGSILGSSLPPSEPPLCYNTSSPGPSRSSVSHGTPSSPQPSPSTSFTPSSSAVPAHTLHIEPSVPPSPVPVSPEPLQVESGSDRAILAMISPQVPIVRPLHRKQCIVADCHELIAPTMWRSHMGLHARGLFRGDVPREWLQEQGLYICDCRALVAKSRRASHSRRCLGSSSGSSTDTIAFGNRVLAQYKHSFTIF